MSVDSKYLKTIEMYIFSDKLANVYIRNYVKGDRPKFMVKSGVQFLEMLYYVVIIIILES